MKRKKFIVMHDEVNAVVIATSLNVLEVVIMIFRCRTP